MVWYTGYMKPSISYGLRNESPEAKARWFQSLSVEERMAYLDAFTEMALSVNPDLPDKKHAVPIPGRVRVLTLPRR